MRAASGAEGWRKEDRKKKKGEDGEENWQWHYAFKVALGKVLCLRKKKNNSTHFSLKHKVGQTRRK